MTLSLTHSTVVGVPDDGTSPVGTDEWNAAHSTSMATNMLLGRGTAGTGSIEEITLGTNLSFTGTTLNAAGGGGGTPGGSSLQIQYNNSSAFGGMAGTSWDDTNRSLTITGATVTTSKPVIDAVQTWNSGAVTFTGYRFKVISTASAGASKPFDVQVDNGTNSGSCFYVASTDGNIVINQVGSAISTTPFRVQNQGSDVITVSTTSISLAQSSSLINLRTSSGINWEGNAQLWSDAANVIASRVGTSAQTFRVYNTFTDLSNYERHSTIWSSNVCYLKNENAGTGSARLMIPVTGTTTVSGLPSASTAGAGARAMVTDANATTFLTTVAGGGSNIVPVVSDGTNWKIG